MLAILANPEGTTETSNFCLGKNYRELRDKHHKKYRQKFHQIQIFFDAGHLAFSNFRLS